LQQPSYKEAGLTGLQKPVVSQQCRVWREKSPWWGSQSIIHTTLFVNNQAHAENYNI